MAPQPHLTGHARGWEKPADLDDFSACIHATPFVHSCYRTPCIRATGFRASMLQTLPPFLIEAGEQEAFRFLQEK